MRQYENEVQKIKSEVLKMVAKAAVGNDLSRQINKIPYELNPGPEGRYRCCVHHERAVTSERVQMALGGNDHDHEIVEVLSSACDQCLVNRYVVTETCRGCLAHRCVASCPVKAISVINGKAVIDHKRCIECGKCQKTCPYSAIADVMRPCRKGCPTDAIKMDDNKRAIIDYNLCITCGACVYNCPFGAIQDKSELLKVVDILKDNKPVYAVVAPAFATQFEYTSLEQVITGIKALGFQDVIEAALGADLVAKHEVEELHEHLQENDFMTSSCCPAFKNYLDKKFPDLKEMVSKTVSPMVATARLVKTIDPDSRVVFIGPCIGKKYEKLSYQEVDHVLTFEELSALIEAYDLDLNQLEPSPLNNASYYGRMFPVAGGVASAIKTGYQTQFDTCIDILNADGGKACDMVLKKAKAGLIKNTFIEGMACSGGCIKGPVTMHYGPKDVKAIEKYAKKAHEHDMDSATTLFNNLDLDLKRQ